MPATPRDISGESEEERQRRIRIFLMLRRREQEQQEKPPLARTLRQAEDLYKAREARKERRDQAF